MIVLSLLDVAKIRRMRFSTLSDCALDGFKTFGQRWLRLFVLRRIFLPSPRVLKDVDSQ